MIIRLFKRHHGIHHLIKEGIVEGSFRRYGKETANGEYIINEERLVNALPNDFINAPLKNVLLIIKDSKYGSTAVSGLKHFSPWAKYFDSYSLELTRKK